MVRAARRLMFQQKLSNDSCARGVGAGQGARTRAQLATKIVLDIILAVGYRRST
jgi:hypothetical protein